MQQQESTRCKVTKILGSVFRLQVRLVLDGTRHPGIAGSASLGRGPTKVSHAPSSTCSTRRMRSKPVARRVAQGKEITPLSCLNNAIRAWNPRKKALRKLFLYYPNGRLACMFKYYAELCNFLYSHFVSKITSSLNKRRSKTILFPRLCILILRNCLCRRTNLSGVTCLTLWRLTTPTGVVPHR